MLILSGRGPPTFQLGLNFQHQPTRKGTGGPPPAGGGFGATADDPNDYFHLLFDDVQIRYQSRSASISLQSTVPITAPDCVLPVSVMGGTVPINDEQHY